jgi:transposase
VRCRKIFRRARRFRGYFYRWREDGTWHRINADLVGQARKAEGRNRVSSAGIIDSQSVKTTQSGGRAGLMPPGG